MGLRRPRYKSGLESDLHKGPLKGWQYEPFQKDFVIHSKYTPDFVNEKETIWVEAKGFFRHGDQKKYKAIRDHFPNIELVFILSNPYRRARKDVKLTMSKWCEKEGFRWYPANKVPDNLGEK